MVAWLSVVGTAEDVVVFVSGFVSGLVIGRVAWVMFVSWIGGQPWRSRKTILARFGGR